ncbi:Txe/YoeB family addiction module toxin [Pseudomonas daroniae]|uniref:Putative mRNA interferase YoeB n=1 Tax=Phytopseudomonas daroniae TaxID=2487519 RepID=A0A4Q9QKF7_9GAMM|nr:MULTISPECIES: Txe/YoeB family addiction module toxin [Pseudomonas]TBU79251.1 Txe/YoeB family addiction module toxin [Pseudomonas daroniae]TBU80033.1 Txe/YoeB family addiction module toxin [Pseudomonas sp. FRB 228]TBU91351.1 Txe/YoeB family addiction module toxin [Pseudomonas daroniae]
MTWQLAFTKQAQKDAKKLAAAGLKDKAKALLDVVQVNPFQNPPPYEKLVGDLSGAYSRRINIQHRLVYQVLQDAQVVKVLRLWTHYE